jgi:hypothetical protein
MTGQVADSILPIVTDRGSREEATEGGARSTQSNEGVRTIADRS